MTKIKQAKLVVILGPTASGKSYLGIKLARKFNGEIISADSRQVYKKLDIGTGKVTKKEQRLVRHHLLDIASPKKIFTVSDFKNLGEKAIQNIITKNKVPFIVGGTGFYIDALVYDLNFPQVQPNKLLRLNLNRLTDEQLFHKLKNLDSQRAKNIDRYNKRRLIRALEIIKATGKPVPKLISSTKYRVLWLGLKPKNLEKKINLRLEKRLKQGMVKEVKNLLRFGVSRKRLYDLGLEYRWINDYLASKISYEEMKKGLYQAIVKYSKRQLTWFKINKEIHWLAPSKVEGIKNQREAGILIQDFFRSPLAT